MADHDHIYKPFDQELNALKAQLASMGSTVDAHIADSVRALLERDAGLARRVIESDRAVNAMELAVDEQCVRMLALRQPAGSDLRFLAAALKIVTDLERIGDLAVNMAERAEMLAAEPPLDVPVDLTRMATAARKMLQDAIDAFVTRDVAKAETVLAADARIDAWLVEAFDQLRDGMKKDAGRIDRGIATIFFAKHIERLADHTTNIAEMVVFLARGKDIRHARTR